ncbi:hypothetical protein IJ541_00445 [bacterium]|nr:hypothetical protein [bacterium]
MSYDRKLIRNGNGWALTINSTILGFLDVNPEINLIKYTMENDKLIISKSDKKVSDVKSKSK